MRLKCICGKMLHDEFDVIGKFVEKDKVFNVDDFQSFVENSVEIWKCPNCGRIVVDEDFYDINKLEDETD